MGVLCLRLGVSQRARAMRVCVNGGEGGRSGGWRREDRGARLVESEYMRGAGGADGGGRSVGVVVVPGEEAVAFALPSVDRAVTWWIVGG